MSRELKPGALTMWIGIAILGFHFGGTLGAGIVITVAGLINAVLEAD